MKEKKISGKEYRHLYYLAHKERHASMAKAWREGHREEEAAKKKTYYSEHKKELNEKAKARRNKDREGYRERGRAFYAANRERMREEYRKNREKRLATAKKYAINHKEEVAARQKAYRLSHLEELREKARARGLAHKEQKRTYRIEHKGRAREVRLLREYGISVGEFDAMLIQQGGVCAICKNPNWPVRGKYVDHNHNGGKPRGILCYNCNVAIGHLKDNVTIAKSLVRYLEKAK